MEATEEYAVEAGQGTVRGNKDLAPVQDVSYPSSGGSGLHYGWAWGVHAIVHTAGVIAPLMGVPSVDMSTS